MASIVYVLTNAGMPGLLKIGKTDRDNPDQRMSELYTTGVPFPFECVKAVEVADNQQAAQLEDALHKAFHPHRPNKSREFFRIAQEHVFAILDVWPNGKDVTDGAQQEVEEGTEEQEREAVKREKKRRRPNLDFEELGIHRGEQLMFTGFREDGENIAAVVEDNKKVRFRGEVMFLTMATLRALGRPDSTPIRPAPYWSWKGRVLEDLYEELHG